jgi:endonuclease/exonuclease/phosphatase family metal-dependent hydrolase
MFSRFSSSFLLLCLLIGSALQAQPLQVATFNIRLDVASDSPNHWAARKDKVCAQILFHQWDLVGVQEALPNQANDMKTMLPGFGFAGVGRDDGKEKGEFSGIFFRKERLELLESNTFWLSLTPTVPGSKSWDAAITRIVTWARFKDKQNGKIFYHFNTHFDHIGKEARRQSAQMLLEKVNSIAGKASALITGDFNAKPTDEPISIIVDVNNPLHLTDTKGISAMPHYGPQGTFTAFGPKELDDQPIDHIFIKGNWKVLQHATISQTWNGRFASDHFAVMAVMQLQ